MNNRELIKAAAGLVVSASTGAVLSNVIKATTPLEVSTTQKVMISVGGMVLTGMVSSIAVTYTNMQLDYIFETIDNVKHRTNHAE